MRHLVQEEILKDGGNEATRGVEGTGECDQEKGDLGQAVES